METIIKTNFAGTQTVQNHKKSASVLSLWFEYAEQSRFGIIPILVTIIGCMGGVAAAFGAGDDVVKLGLIAFPSIITLALTLAVAPMRPIITLGAVAILLDIAVLIF